MSERELFLRFLFRVIKDGGTRKPEIGKRQTLRIRTT